MGTVILSPDWGSEEKVERYAAPCVNVALGALICERTLVEVAAFAGKLPHGEVLLGFKLEVVRKNF